MYTYEEARAFLAKARNPARGRPVANHTRLVDRGDHVAVVLHATTVVRIYKGDVYELCTGNYYTATTKDRINTFSPARLYSVNGLWYTGADNIFREGMRITADGRELFTEASSIETKKKALDRAVRDYVKGFLAHLATEGLKDPGPGDCFYCQGAMSDALDHLVEHMIESYYVPSLLWNAVRETAGTYDCARFWWKSLRADLEHGRATSWQAARALRRYFRSRKVKLLPSFDPVTFKARRKAYLAGRAAEE